MPLFRSTQHPAQSRPPAGMTMVELLVVVALIAILASLLTAATRSVGRAGDRTEAVSNMRQIGVGIHRHAAEHDGALPGPLWPGQIPILKPDRDGRLVRELAPYLGIPIPGNPQVIDLFVPPAYRKEMGESFVRNDPRTFVMNMEVPVAGIGVANPWGTLTEEGSQPAKLTLIPGAVWAFSDADRQHPRVASAPWKVRTPAEPIHGDRRLAWFFDGRVAPVSEDELMSTDAE